MVSQKIAAVTGGNKGIGLSIVRALCKQFDGDVYLTARDEGRGKQAVKELEKEGLHPKFQILDISNVKSVDDFKNFLIKEYGGIDVFVHNAGIAYSAKDPTPPYEQAKVTISVNYTSAVNVCDTILPIMKPHGRMCILASQSGTYALSRCSAQNRLLFKSPDITIEQLDKMMEDFVSSAEDSSYEKMGFSNSAYGMSKLGVIVYTRILGKRANGLSQANVLVNSCCPGYVNTDMTSHAGHLTPEEGAVTPTFLALIPKEETKPNGEFVYAKKVVKWY